MIDLLLTDEDQATILQFTRWDHPLNMKIRAEVRRRQEEIDAKLTREKLSRDVRIHVQENGGKIDLLKPYTPRKHRKHQPPVKKTPAEIRKEKATKLIASLSPEQKAALIRKLSK
jgi:hypothetical protein